MSFFDLPYNVTNWQELLVYNNHVTNDMFGMMLLLIVFSISFITMLPFGNKQSFAASLWITAVVSIFLWILQLVNPGIIVFLAVVTAFSMIFLFRTKEN